MNSQCKKGSVRKILILVSNLFRQGELIQSQGCYTHTLLVMTRQDRTGWRKEPRNRAQDCRGSKVPAYVCGRAGQQSSDPCCSTWWNCFFSCQSFYGFLSTYFMSNKVFQYTVTMLVCINHKPFFLFQQKNLNSC